MGLFVIFKKTNILLVILVFLIAWMTYVSFTVGVPASAPVLPDTIIIDPGHGGLDSGAVSKTGVEEKNINLAIGLLLREIAQQNGINVIMTRTEDISLHTTESAKIRVQKRSDLEVRKRMLNETGAAAYISIHINKFEQSKYRGAQVFYANNDKSKQLATLIQKSLIEGIADGNTREAKTIPTGAYIYKGTKQTAVIVECGFLSNPDEELLLQQEEYQKRVAACIWNGVKNYMGINE